MGKGKYVGKELRQNNKGFTFVELLCAVAIFAMVIAAVGGIMVFTSKTYHTGAKETEIQQEAQFAANRISGIIQDATAVNVTPLAGSNTPQVDFEVGDVKHIITFNESAHELKYEQTSPTESTGQQLLASNISNFVVDASDFEKSRTVNMDMTVKDEVNDKEYKMSYSMKARNEAVTVVAGGLQRTASIIVPDKIIMIPGETYTLTADVRGTTQGINAGSSGVNATVSGNNVTIQVPTSASGDTSIPVVIATNETNDVGDPLDEKRIYVLVRRVDTLKVEHACTYGTDGEVGAEYTFYARVQKGSNLDKGIGADWDANYKNPRAVQWSQEFTVGGAAANFNDYFEVALKQEDETALALTRYSIVYKLKQEVPYGSKLIVTAKSKHANGKNKADSAYATVTASDALVPGVAASEIPLGSTTVVMEPGETRVISGLGLTGSATVTKSGNSSTSTTAVYTESDGTVKISLAAAEKGDASGKITVEAALNANPSNKAQITVMVRRVNDIAVTYTRNSGTHLSEGAQYTFTTDYDGTFLAERSAEEEGTTYVNAYATKFSWKYTVNGATVSNGTGNYDYKSNSAEGCTTDAANDYFGVTGFDFTSDKPKMTVKLKKDMPVNSELEVTVTSLHAGGVNKSSTNYAEVKATCILKAEKLINITDDDLAIVEPGQGVSTEFAIPVYVDSSIAGSVSSMEAKLTGVSTGSSSKVMEVKKYQNNIWDVILLIDEDEKGNNGELTMTVTAKDSDGVICKVDLTLGIRRVTEVAFTSDTFDNTTGTKTLSVEVDGYKGSANNIDYMEKYNKADKGGNTPPRWDRDYVNPYPVKWELIINNTTYNLSAGQTNDYISNFAYDKTTIDSKQTANFSLNKKLPKGAVIKATSLHSIGENKSDKDYGEVFGTLEIETTTTIDGVEKNSEVQFRRGMTNYDVYTSGNTYGTIQSMVSEHATKNGGYSWDVQGRFFYRFREEGGNWSQYLMFNDTSQDDVLMEGYTNWVGSSGQSCIFHPQKAYDFEVMYIAYDARTKEIHWPWNDVVLTEGFGFKEYGFTFSDFAEESRQTYGDTPLEECVVKDYVPAGDIYFTKNEALDQYEEKSHFMGIHSNEETPLQVRAWSEKEDSKTLYIDADALALIDPESHQASYKYVIQQKKSSGAWEDIVKNANVDRWDLVATQGQYYKINDVYEAIGEYRFGVLLEDWPYAEIHLREMISPETKLSDMLSNEERVTLHNMNFEYFDWNTGEYVVYVEFNGYAKKGNTTLNLEKDRKGNDIDLTAMKSGDYIDVKYTQSWANGGTLILQAGSRQIEVKPTEKYTDGSGYSSAKFSYSDIIAAYGSSDLSGVDKISIKASDTDSVIVRKLDLVLSSGVKNIW